MPRTLFPLSDLPIVFLLQNAMIGMCLYLFENSLCSVDMVPLFYKVAIIYSMCVNDASIVHGCCTGVASSPRSV